MPQATISPIVLNLFYAAIGVRHQTQALAMIDSRRDYLANLATSTVRKSTKEYAYISVPHVEPDALTVALANAKQSDDGTWHTNAAERFHPMLTAVEPWSHIPHFEIRIYATPRYVVANDKRYEVQSSMRSIMIASHAPFDVQEISESVPIQEIHRQVVQILEWGVGINVAFEHVKNMTMTTHLKDMFDDASQNIIYAVENGLMQQIVD